MRLKRTVMAAQIAVTAFAIPGKSSAQVEINSILFPCQAFSILKWEAEQYPTNQTKAKKAVDDLLKNGVVLTYDSRVADRNRATVCGGRDVTEARVEANDNFAAKVDDTFSCDEFPFATTRQGGGGAKVTIMTSKQNSGAGGALGGYINSFRLRDGDNFTVTVTNWNPKMNELIHPQGTWYNFSICAKPKDWNAQMRAMNNTNTAGPSTRSGDNLGARWWAGYWH